MNIDFPGLSCDMLLVVASIGLDGLLGMEALKSCLPPPAGFKDRTIVGGRPVDAAVASTETGLRCGRSPDLFGSTAPG